MIIKEKFELLDCTLRDGGYYNNWNFSKKLIQEYLNFIQTTKIKFIELGFRFSEESKKKGLTAYTNKNLISNLLIPKKVKIGIMINVGDFIQNKKFNIQKLKRIVNKKNIKKLNFIRLACHHNEVFCLNECFRYLLSLRLKVFVNIMQITEIDNKNLKKILIFLKNCKISIIYLADSLGCLDLKKLKSLIKVIKKNWQGEVGLHAHNNLKQAFKNSSFAIKNNFKWIDSTITGMGRGPGNLKTEEIIKSSKYYQSTKEFVKIKSYFYKLKKLYKWGPNKYYRYAAQKKIHPTYIQKLLADKRYTVRDYKKILNSLAKENTKKYNPYKLANSTNFISSKIKTNWSPKNILQNKKVLILGPGINLKKNIKKIEREILDKNLFVISLNTFSSIKENLINLRVICHPFRISSDKINLEKFKSKFIIPLSSFATNFKKSIKLKKSKYFDYGLKIGSESQLYVKNNYCVLPYPLGIGYALSLSISGKVKTVKLAGFDGYEKSDPDYDNTEELLKKFINKYFKNKLFSLTKTKINQLRYKEKY